MSVQVTNSDIVLLGHGSYAGGATNTKLPVNVDLYVLQPVGYTLTTDVAAALIQQTKINQLILHHDNGSGDTPIDAPVAVYKGGNLAPDLTLYNLGDLAGWGNTIIGTKTNVVTVNAPTLLSKLLATDPKIAAAISKLPKGQNLKIYWSACASQVSGNRASLK